MAINITSPTEMTSYLNDYQSNLNSMQGYDPLEDGSVDKFMEEELGMTGKPPEAPKYVDMYKDMREQFGVTELEQSMAWYKDMIRREELLLNQQKNYMREQPVRLGVIEGRVDKATRDRQEQIQWYSNELSRVSDMAQGAYTQIQMIMQLTQMDYETAKDSYQTEFNNRMSVYKAVTDQFNADRAFASTQWSMMASYISKGQMTWDSMSKDQKAQITKYETMMGLPVGFMSKLKMEAGANVIATSTRVDPSGNTYSDIIYKDANGATKVQHVLLGKTKTSSGGGGGLTYAQQKEILEKQNLDKTITQFNKAFTGYKLVDTGYQTKQEPVQGKDGKVAPTTYKELRSEWVQKGYSGDKFDELYAQKYVNESHWWDYGGQLEKYF